MVGLIKIVFNIFKYDSLTQYRNIEPRISFRLKINPEVYYMNFIPVKINISQILMINSITIIVSLLSIFISSMIITKLKTIKLINFN